MRKTIFAVLLCALLLTACSAKQTASPVQQTASPAEPFQKLRHAEISVKDYGTIPPAQQPVIESIVITD